MFKSLSDVVSVPKGVVFEIVRLLTQNPLGAWLGLRTEVQDEVCGTFGSRLSNTIIS